MRTKKPWTQPRPTGGNAADGRSVRRVERGMIRERVMAGLARVRAEGKKTLGRPKVGKKVDTPYALDCRLATGC
jgi:hypothetical protein